MESGMASSLTNGPARGLPPGDSEPDPGGIGSALWAGLFSFRGEATRFEWWMASIGALVIGSTLGLAARAVAGTPLDREASPGLGMAIFSIAVYVVITWVQFAATARRLRDRGWSTELILAGLLGPSLAVIAAFVFVVSGAFGIGMFLGVASLLGALWVLIECGFLPSR
jgi:uncharacterized membrane protein YhaH (DUF805 family)